MRIRITFSRGSEIKYISHLDLMRMWERVFRRAAVPLAYTKGFNPHPRLTLAAPLPVGVLASAEMAEVYLEAAVAVSEFEEAISTQLPPGVSVSRVEEIEATAPPLPSVVKAVEYEASIAEPLSRRQVEERIDRLLGSIKLPRERPRKGEGKAQEVRRYDLRPLVEDIWIERWNSERVIGMRLRSDPTGTGRPEEVLDELRLSTYVSEVARTKVVLREAGE